MFPLLFEPIRLGKIESRNRILMPSMGTLFSMDQKLNERHVRFYERRAEGGAGIIVAGPVGVDFIGSGAITLSLMDDVLHSVLQRARRPGARTRIQDHAAALPRGPVHLFLHDRGAAGHRTLCRPVSIHRRGAERDDPRGHREGAGRLCTGGAPGQGSRDRWRGDHRLGRLPDQPVSLPGHQPANRRVRGLLREPGSLRGGDDQESPGRGGRRLYRDDPGGRERLHSRGQHKRGVGALLPALRRGGGGWDQRDRRLARGLCRPAHHGGAPGRVRLPGGRHPQCREHARSSHPTGSRIRGPRKGSWQREWPTWSPWAAC